MATTNNQRPIYDLDLCVRLNNILLLNGYRTIEDVRTLADWDLICLLVKQGHTFFIKRALKQVHDALDEHKLYVQSKYTAVLNLYTYLNDLGIARSFNSDMLTIACYGCTSDMVSLVNGLNYGHVPPIYKLVATNKYLSWKIELVG